MPQREEMQWSQQALEKGFKNEDHANTFIRTKGGYLQTQKKTMSVYQILETYNMGEVICIIPCLWASQEYVATIVTDVLRKNRKELRKSWWEDWFLGFKIHTLM